MTLRDSVWSESSWESSSCLRVGRELTVAEALGAVQEPGRKGTSAVGSRYKKTDEDTADWEF
jgi:hypothetical protein